MNIRPSTFSFSEFKTAFYLVKDHTSKGLKLITFGLDKIEFSDGYGPAHIRCLKD